ncbi:hypothetical protein HUK83_17750, partial [Endobacter medicaginis]
MIESNDIIVLGLVALCLLALACTLLALRRRDPAVARLLLMAEQGEGARRTEAEQAGRRLVELERAVIARLEQGRIE